MIRRLINDSNFNVVLWTLKILAILSKGLRRHFFQVVKSVFANVIAKFRDKKTQMIDETFNTLNDFMYSISIEDVLDDVKEGLGDKAPNMKVNLINWIGKFVEKK
jgi:DNA-binding transcriptional regulator GbsR (MarR family)